MGATTMSSWGWLPCQPRVFLRWSVPQAHWEVIHERCKASIDDLRLSKGYCNRSGIDDRGPRTPDRSNRREGRGDCKLNHEAVFCTSQREGGTETSSLCGESFSSRIGLLRWRVRHFSESTVRSSQIPNHLFIPDKGAWPYFPYDLRPEASAVHSGRAPRTGKHGRKRDSGKLHSALQSPWNQSRAANDSEGEEP